MAKRLAVFVYGSVSYLAFFLTLVYAVGFIGNLYVPKSMDSAARMSFLPALVIDALLLLMFPICAYANDSEWLMSRNEGNAE